MRPGDVVTLLVHPGIAYPVAYLGAAKVGAITAGINPRFSRPEKEHLLEDTRAVALITDDPDAPVPRIVLSPEQLLRPGAEPPRIDTSPDDAVAIVYTSGTTGLPKGATFTAGALQAVRRIEEALEPAPSPKGIQAIPMAHMGFMTKIASFIQKRSTAVLMERWSPRAALETIERERLTAIGGVPTQLALMLDDPSFPDADLSSLRSCTIGGAPASPDLVRRIRQGLGTPVFVRYSCTELAVATGTRASDPDVVVARSVGRPLPEVELRIAQATADGVGQVLVRSPAMMRGYWHDDATTAAAFDEEGYFRTGDLGRIDDAGNLRLAGRIREMYIRGGYNVYPLEVEHALRRHPGVVEAAVVGIPDPIYGERGRAFVVPVDPDRPPGIEELRAHLSELLASYKIPDDFELRSRLPMTSMFKVDKRALID